MTIEPIPEWYGQEVIYSIVEYRLFDIDKTYEELDPETFKRLHADCATPDEYRAFVRGWRAGRADTRPRRGESR